LPGKVSAKLLLYGHISHIFAQLQSKERRQTAGRMGILCNFHGIRRLHHHDVDLLPAQVQIGHEEYDVSATIKHPFHFS
jgi:hypothetical protein